MKFWWWPLTVGDFVLPTMAKFGQKVREFLKFSEFLKILFYFFEILHIFEISQQNQV